MGREKVLVLGLDGVEISYLQQLIDEGELPALAAFRDASARVLLDHGHAQRTGLGWEHFWSGLTPEASGRASAVELDPQTYAAWQEGARFAPFFAPLDVRAVVLDPPYVDLRRAPGVNGVVAWGAHDPGLAGAMASPSTLLGELTATVGDYCAKQWTYGVPWPSSEACLAMGEGLVAGVEQREEAACWLLTERFPDWDLAVVVVAETHGGAEGLWHGVDADHPLHDHPSSEAAAGALVDTHRAVDHLVGRLVYETDATAVVVFAMGGMGVNRSDVQSMVLLPELLHRWAFGEPLLEIPEEWSTDPTCIPTVQGERATWSPALYPSVPPGGGRSRFSGLVDRMPAPLARWIRDTRSTRRSRVRVAGYQSVAWQPAAKYQPRWREMHAFAVPSFYDGRIRVNLRGREGSGLVDLADYASICDELEELVRECVDPRTGESVVAAVERPDTGDPLTLDSSASDLVVIWRDASVAFEHPVHGVVGPVNFRRVGGHTGPYGFAWLSWPGVVVGDHGVASSFDVAPTVVELLGAGAAEEISGSSLLGLLSAVSATG